MRGDCFAVSDYFVIAIRRQAEKQSRRWQVTRVHGEEIASSFLLAMTKVGEPT
jgi:hypothetical protein